jgi:hypothetical protein
MRDGVTRLTQRAKGTRPRRGPHEIFRGLSGACRPGPGAGSARVPRRVGRT